MKKTLKKLRSRLEQTKLWDKLFLDFYLNKNWTLRFKILNFLSGGDLIYYVIGAWRELRYCNQFEPDTPMRIHFERVGRLHAEESLNQLIASWQHRDP